MTRRAQLTLVGVVGVVLGSSGCADDGERSCAELDVALEEFQPSAADAWEDISALQLDIERGLALEREFADRCG